jgi:hypothetical protein
LIEDLGESKVAPEELGATAVDPVEVRIARVT